MDNEDEVRQRAHHIWRAEGKPDGKAAEHWQRAEHEVACRRLGQSATRLALTALFFPAHVTLAVLRAFAMRRNHGN